MFVQDYTNQQLFSTDLCTYLFFCIFTMYTCLSPVTGFLNSIPQHSCQFYSPAKGKSNLCDMIWQYWQIRLRQPICYAGPRNALRSSTITVPSAVVHLCNIMPMWTGQKQVMEPCDCCTVLTTEVRVSQFPGVWSM